MNKHLAAKQAEMRKRMAEQYPNGVQKKKKKEIRYFSFKEEIKSDPPKLKAPINSHSASAISLAAPSMLVINERSFSESCLSKMGIVARGTVRLFSWPLRELPEKWSFLDKLLVFLEPSFKDDVGKFYDNDGPSMTDIYNANQLDRLDKMLAEHLQMKLDILKR